MARGSGTGTRATAFVAGIVATAVVAGCGGSSPKLVSIGAGLQGPADVVATVYARGMEHAAAFALDAQDRLWVATADYEDTGDDSVFLVATKGAEPVEVVSGLHTPLGLLWYRDRLYVASTGKVEAFGDLHGSKFSSRRTIVTLPAKVGESNNLALGADGRMLLGISAPCDHCMPTSRLSGAIVSFEPDGSDVQVFATGIRAPIGLAYYPGTDNLLVTMNQRDDLGASTPGDWLALVHANDDWQFPGCYGQDGSACAGVPEPVAELDEHAAAAGLAIVTGQLGETVGTAALVAEWAKGRVLRVTLEPSGDGYTGRAFPLITGIAHPVAVILKDEAVLVSDWKTGKIYEITAR